MKWQDFIEERKDVMLGKPVFKGTRVTVEHILRELGTGMTQQDVLDNSPDAHARAPAGGDELRGRRGHDGREHSSIVARDGHEALRRRERRPRDRAVAAGRRTRRTVCGRGRPRRLADFLHAALQPIAAAKPNAAHRAIAELEEHVGVTVVTQNIDRLHQEAGSTVVHEMHGSLFEVVSRRGRFVRLLSRLQLLRMASRLDRARHGWLVLPRVLLVIRSLVGIGLHGLHFPRIVLFGNVMIEPEWSRALETCRRCDCMIQVGTSGTVMPAALLPLEAKAAGAKVITIDPNGGEGDVWLQGKAATLLPCLIEAAFEPNDGA